MIPSPLPKGTTLEEWLDYEDQEAIHKVHIATRRNELDRILNYLAWKTPQKTSWTLVEIGETMRAEINMSSSCDAPDKPRYYRANND